LVHLSTLYPLLWSTITTNPSMILSIFSSLLIIYLVYKLQRTSSSSGQHIAVFQAIGTNVPLNQAGGDYFKGICQSLNFAPETLEKVNKIVNASGIDARGSVCADVPSSEFIKTLEQPGFRGKKWEDEATRMAVAAANAALSAWTNGSRTDITHVVVHSCTGFSAPGLDFQLINQLNLPSSTRKIGVNFMGCFGAFTGLYVAKQIVEADPTGKSVVLVVCAEICSLHASRDSRVEMIVGNTLFADGAAATIISSHKFMGKRLPVSQRPALPALSKAVDLSNLHWAIGTMSSEIVPDSAGAMTWRQSADGGRYDMYLDRIIPKALSGAFSSNGMNMLRKVGINNIWSCAWAIHPGGKAILEVFKTILHTLGSKAEGMEASFGVLRDHGNMSSPTILFVLQRVLTTTERNNVFFAGFGPGLTIEYGRIYKLNSINTDPEPTSEAEIKDLANIINEQKINDKSVSGNSGSSAPSTIASKPGLSTTDTDNYRSTSSTSPSNVSSEVSSTSVSSGQNSDAETDNKNKKTIEKTLNNNKISTPVRKTIVKETIRLSSK